MKNQILLPIYLISMFLGHAQNKQLLYDFYEIPQALMSNPGAKTFFQWHTGLPALSGTYFQAGTSDLSVYDLFADDGVDFTTKVRDRVLYSLNDRDDVSVTFQIEFFNIGFRGKNRPDDYYSFGMYGEGSVLNYWPQDLAILAFEGNANNLNRRFDLSDFNLSGELVNVLHFGVNRKMNDKLYLGARAKLYSSVAEFKSTNNTGYFVTTEGDNNLLENTLVANMLMRTSGVEAFFEDDTDDSAADILLRRGLLGGNLGLGLDFGFTYQLKKNTFITASVLDFGFIHHNKAVKNYVLNGATTNEGIELILPEDINSINTDEWEELVSQIEEDVPFETNEDSYLSFRPLKLNASYRYNFGEYNTRDENCYCGFDELTNPNNVDYLNSVGGQLYMIARPKGPQFALTGFYQRRIRNFLAVKTTYTIDKYSFSNIGLGLNFQAGPVNFYVLADNLLGYQNVPASHYASLQFGFNILSWNKN